MFLFILFCCHKHGLSVAALIFLNMQSWSKGPSAESACNVYVALSKEYMQANCNSLPEKNDGKVCNQQYGLGHLRHEICPVAHHELLTWAACATSRGPKSN